jgi:hypothetical protein
VYRYRERVRYVKRGNEYQKPVFDDPHYWWEKLRMNKTPGPEPE